MGFLLYKKSYIQYDLLFLKCDKLYISVYPDLKVLVYAPLGTPLPKINNHLRAKLYYIFKKYYNLKNVLPKPPYLQALEGHKHVYIGRRYNTKIFLKQPLNKVYFQEGYLMIHVRQKCNIPSLLREWYTQQAFVKFNERLKKCMISSGIFYNALKISTEYSKKFTLKCTPSRLFFLNVLLIKSPIYVIDYVIYHALCHTRILNHSSRFHLLLNSILPPQINKYFKIPN